ncbi:MAG TPA: hypothetical protein VK891_13130 [Euzebyales bacterium]|nr:hypothetical protein [Euzebyales bacterium]
MNAASLAVRGGDQADGDLTLDARLRGPPDRARDIEALEVASERELGGDAVLDRRRPQLGETGDLRHGGGWPAVPHLVDQAVRRHHGVGADEQVREHQPLFRTAQRECPPVVQGLQGPQAPDLHGSSVCEDG